MFTRALRARRACRLIVPNATPPLRYVTASAFRKSPHALAQDFTITEDFDGGPPSLSHVDSTLPATSALPPPSYDALAESSTSRPSSLSRSYTILPTPLPPDVTADTNHLIHFPSSSTHSSLSLIEVCLRKPETTDRAYSIFAALIRDHELGKVGIPPAEAWGSVIEGCGAMGADYIHTNVVGSGSELDPNVLKKMSMWRRRAEGIVTKWEDVTARNWRAEKGLPALDSEGHEMEEAGRAGSSKQVWQGPFKGTELMTEIVLDKDGTKVYQGWLRGCLHSKADLSTFMTHLDGLRIPFTSLLPCLNSDERPIAFETLASTARRLGREDLLLQVEGMRTAEQEELARSAQGDGHRVTPKPVIKPIIGTASTTEPMMERAKLAGESEDDVELPRFAVINLRASLRAIQDTKGKDPVTRQQMLEAASLAAAKAELAHAAALVEQQNLTSVKDAHRLGDRQLQAWMHHWSVELTKKLEATVAEMTAKSVRAAFGSRGLRMRPSKMSKLPRPGANDSDLLLYLRLLSAEKLALVTILEVMRLAGTGGVSDGMKTARALMTVGKAIETEYRAGALRDVVGVGSKNWLRDLNSGQEIVRIRSEGPQQIDYIWDRLGHVISSESQGQDAAHSSKDATDKTGSSLEKAQRNETLVQSMKTVWMPTWSQATHVALGSILVHALIETATVMRYAKDEDGVVHSEPQPAFIHSYEYVYGKKLGIISLNPQVSKRMASDSIGIMLHPKHLPMLAPPRPWRAHNSGGYLFHSVHAMRYKDSPEQAAYFRSASEEGNLDAVFAGMDVLSGTPWRINRAVFGVMLEVWNQGIAIADVPAGPEIANYVVPKREGGEGPEERARYVQAMRDYTLQVQKDHGERCKYNYSLEIAKAYLDEEFYIPHNLDFRGRAYPIPPHLSPVGDDFSRGLLTFAQKKPLGERGLMWLKIHVANLCGFDKASFSDREKYSDQHLDEIFDSADNPLGGKRWWLSADAPWQCLATCIELTNALRSGDPLTYESSLPVHQDGTCNGMQHYAALGGDPEGAAAVNLDAGDRPSDVYTNIADLVSAVVEKDAERGVPLAIMLKGKIGRKVVKQTVMTTVYGVTFIGAKDQIAKQLKDRGDIAPQDVYQASSYVARTVLTCIGTLFGGAKAIQDWLGLSARFITNSVVEARVPQSQETLQGRAGGHLQAPVLAETGEPMTRASKELMSAVIWTTPLGLPVVQPYRKKMAKQTTTALQTVFISDPNIITEVSPAKQASGLPPNFIHSLDATHMIMTADRCKKDDITFASVHDSYWSHACSIDGLSAHIREAFIDLHSRDIIGELRKEFVERYKDNWIPRRVALTLATRFATIHPELMPPILTQRFGPNKMATDKNEVAELDPEEADSMFAVQERRDGTTESTEAGDMATPATERVLFNAKQYHRLADCFPACPPRGTFDVNRIRLSPYFFS